MMGDNTPVYRNLRVFLDHGVRRVTSGKILVYADDTVIAAEEICMESPRNPTMVVPDDVRKDARVVFWGDGKTEELTYLGVQMRATDN